MLKVAPINDDPRVRKQADALIAAGHDVWAVGTTGGRSVPPEWPVIGVEPPSRALPAKVRDALRLAAFGRLPGVAIDRLYWSFREHREMLEAAVRDRADVFVANDWRALPIAVRAAAATGAAVGYDSHELGVEEFLERRIWRMLFPPYIRSLERRYIGAARFVTTVSEGIADILADSYQLDRRPVVIRNVPPYDHSAFRPTGETIEVLYQGMWIGNRGLEPLIDSVRDWRPEFRLTIRGMGKPAYERRLRELVASSQAADRIDLAAPVPMTEMVAAARAADVGIHPLLITSNQMRYTLPNKLFEYLMAGLAVCATDIPEMSAVIDTYGAGVTFEEATPDRIAAAVNGLDRSAIDDYKQGALVAAKELSWEQEAHKFVAEVER